MRVSVPTRDVQFLEWLKAGEEDLSGFPFTVFALGNTQVSGCMLCGGLLMKSDVYHASMSTTMPLESRSISCLASREQSESIIWAWVTIMV